MQNRENSAVDISSFISGQAREGIITNLNCETLNPSNLMYYSETVLFSGELLRMIPTQRNKNLNKIHDLRPLC